MLEATYTADGMHHLHIDGNVNTLVTDTCVLVNLIYQGIKATGDDEDADSYRLALLLNFNSLNSPIWKTGEQALSNLEDGKMTVYE